MPADDPGDILLPVPPSPPAQWCQDLYWHRRNRRQTRLKWGAADVYRLAQQELGSWRTEWTAPTDLPVIFSAATRLWDRGEAVLGHIWGRLVTASSQLIPADMTRARQLLELSVVDAAYCDFAVAASIRPTTPDNADVRRVVTPGTWPWQQPLTEAWEIHHLGDLFLRARDALNDLHLDVCLELAPRLGWAALSRAHTDHLGWEPYTARQLADLCAFEHETRGGPGDPRRLPRPRFGPLPAARETD